MKGPLVTVVTPVYNGAEFLDECIQSVLGQSYWNWEYVILDNCSTDGSFEVAKRYADRDSRIRAIREDTFVSQAKNFNRLLRYISSESVYCKFVLADDWIFANCLDEMVKVAMLRPGEEFEQYLRDPKPFLGVIAERMGAIKARHGGQAFGFFSCSKATNEVNFLAQKFARTVLGSNNIDSCNRT